MKNYFVSVNQEAQSSTTIELLVARGGFTACFPMPFSAVRYLNGSCHYWDSFFLLSRPVTIWGMPLVFSNHAKDKIKINSYCIPDCYFSASRLQNVENNYLRTVFMMKFVFSKKATKIDEIFTVDLTPYNIMSYRWWRFRQFLWPSCKTWTFNIRVGLCVFYFQLKWSSCFKLLHFSLAKKNSVRN